MIVRHSLAYVLARGLPSLLLLATTIVLTKALTPAEYGLYSIVLAWVTLGNLVLFEWLRLSVLRFYPEHRSADSALLSTVLATFLLIAGATAVASTGFLAAMSGVLQSDVILIGVLLLCLQGFHDLSAELGRSRLRPSVYGALNAVRAGGLLLVGGGLARAGWDAEGVLVGLAFAMVLTSAWSWRRLWGATSFSKSDVHLRRRLIELGIPLCAILGLAYILEFSDRLVIDAMLGKAAAGLYSVGYDVPRQTLGAIMMIVTLAGYPLTIRAFEEGGVSAARDQLRSTGNVLLMIAMPAVTGLSLLAGPISRALLGAEYAPMATRLIPIVALGILLNGIRAYFIDHGFSIAKRFRLQLVAVGAGAVVNIPLTVTLVHLFGVMGAAVSTVISYAVALLASGVLVKRVFPVPWPDQLPRVIVATAAMSLLLVLLREPASNLELAIWVVAAALVYGAGCVVLDVHGVRRWLRASVRRRSGGHQK